MRSVGHSDPFPANQLDKDVIANASATPAPVVWSGESGTYVDTSTREECQMENFVQVVNIYVDHALSMYQTSRSTRTFENLCSSMGMHTLHPPIMPVFIQPNQAALLRAKQALSRHFGSGESDGPTLKERYDIDQLVEFFLPWAEVFPFLCPEVNPAEQLELVGNIYTMLARLVGGRTQAQFFTDCNNSAVRDLWEHLNKTGVLLWAEPSSQRVERFEGVYAAVSARLLPDKLCELAMSYVNSHPNARSVLTTLELCEAILADVIPQWPRWHIDPSEGPTRGPRRRRSPSSGLGASLSAGGGTTGRPSTSCSAPSWTRRSPGQSRGTRTTTRSWPGCCSTTRIRTSSLRCRWSSRSITSCSPS